MENERELSMSRPEDLDEAAERVRKLHTALLCDWDEAGAAPPVSQYWLSALALLEQARCQLTLASYCQAQNLAERRQ